MHVPVEGILSGLVLVILFKKIYKYNPAMNTMFIDQ